MPSNPDTCKCGSQLFGAVWSVEAQDGTPRAELDPKQGNTIKRPVGFECVECGRVQFTREIPAEHAEDPALDHPDAADRDMVREGPDAGPEWKQSLYERVKSWFQSKT